MLFKRKITYSYYKSENLLPDLKEKGIFADMNKAVILLGSNLENRISLIEQALDLIEAKVGSIIKKSMIYETPPWGFTSSNTFLNMSIIIESELSAIALLDGCLLIEETLGRIRNKSEDYTDRTIDIDIILFNEEIIDTASLIVPHPRMHERLFCLLPVNDIAPDWHVPTIGLSVKEILLNCKDTSKISVFHDVV